MAQDWQGLTRLTGGAPMRIERVRLLEADVAIEGQFDLPPLAQLSGEDQIFVAAFVRCHGSIKQMEKFFGVSYPTIKNRLNRIGSRLSFAEIEPGESPGETGELLTRLERGEISVADVLARLNSDRSAQGPRDDSAPSSAAQPSGGGSPRREDDGEDHE